MSDGSAKIQETGCLWLKKRDCLVATEGVVRDILNVKWRGYRGMCQRG